MILQYKGFNNNWCYEEANTITWANVWVGKETREYREDSQRYIACLKSRKDFYLKRQAQCRGRKFESTEYQEFLRAKQDFDEASLKYVKEMHQAVDRLIKGETHCSDDIVYLIGNTPFDQLENVCVVMLRDKNKDVTYVFEKGVYILNNSGTTVQRIA